MATYTVLADGGAAASVDETQGRWKTEIVVNENAARAFNGFGSPADVIEFYELGREIGWSFMDDDLDSAGATIKEAGERLQIAQATGRWRVHGGARSPARLVPGDVTALSGLHALTLMIGPSSEQDNPAVFPESASLAQAVLQSRAYWLPAAATEAVLTSDAPPRELIDDIMLPEQRCVVWFAQPARIPDGIVPEPIVAHAAALTEQNGEGKDRFERPAMVSFSGLAHVAHAPHECVVEGVMLTATVDGRLSDGIGWMIRTPPVEDIGVDGRYLILGRRSDAGWSNVVDLLASIICWGDWTIPEPLTLDLAGDRTERRQIRKGKLRRLEEAGGLAGVLVLDATRRSSGRERDAVGTHASPITHVRSGHFKRVPVGPREEQRREIRWISPTIVNPDGAGTRIVRVYRLPGPPRPVVS